MIHLSSSPKGRAPVPFHGASPLWPALPIAIMILSPCAALSQVPRPILGKELRLNNDGAGSPTTLTEANLSTLLTLTTGMPDGTVTSPGWPFQSDLNTGFWRPGADTLAISLGGAERARLDSTGWTVSTAGATSLVLSTDQDGGHSSDITLNGDDALLTVTTGADAIRFKPAGVDSVLMNVTPGTPFTFEGATANAFETSFAITDPTADRTITFKDGTGTVAFTSDIVEADTLATVTGRGSTTSTASSFTGGLTTAAATAGPAMAVELTDGNAITDANNNSYGLNTSATRSGGYSFAGGTDTLAGLRSIVTHSTATTGAAANKKTYGVLATSASTGSHTTGTSVRDSYGIHATGSATDATGETTTAYGGYFTTGSTPDTAYGIYTTTGGTPTTAYALYASGNSTLTGGALDLTGMSLSGASPLVLEGATADGWETTLAVADPAGADYTITIPAATGTVAVTGNAASFTALTGTTSVTAGQLTAPGGVVNIYGDSEGDETAGAEIHFYDEYDTSNAYLYKTTGGLKYYLGSAELLSLFSAASPLYFEGATDNGIYTILAVTDPTSSNKTITLPNATGTVAVSASGTLSLSALGALSWTGASPGAIGSATPSTGYFSTLVGGGLVDALNTVKISTAGVEFEGATADAFETFLVATDTTVSDKTITLPNANGTVVLNSSGDLASPGAIGGTSAAAGTFTTLSGTTSVTGGTGSFTTLAASSTATMSGQLVVSNNSGPSFKVTDTSDAGSGGNLVEQYVQTATNSDPTQNLYIVRAQTTNATETTIFSYGAGVTNQAVMVEARVVSNNPIASGVQSAGYGRAATFNVDSDGGTLQQVGTTTALWDHENDSLWNCQVKTDGGSNIIVTVTGEAGTTIAWHGFITVRSLYN